MAWKLASATFMFIKNQKYNLYWENKFLRQVNYIGYVSKTINYVKFNYVKFFRFLFKEDSLKTKKELGLVYMPHL